MLTTFTEIIDTAKKKGKQRFAVAGAEGGTVLTALRQACGLGIMEPILVGDEEKIQSAAASIQFDVSDIEIIHCAEPGQIARTAVRLVDQGDADALMKGKTDTPILLKAVLNKEFNLRPDGLLSHIALLEVPSYHKLLMITDGGMVIRPDLQQKADIVRNAADMMRRMDIPKPKIAVLAASEKVNPKMPETEDAASLVELAQKGLLGDVELEGPMAMDMALSSEAALIKGVKNTVSGNPDILLVPDISCGNISAKGLIYLASAKVAGLILGARKPIVLF